MKPRVYEAVYKLKNLTNPDDHVTVSGLVIEGKTYYCTDYDVYEHHSGLKMDMTIPKKVSDPILMRINKVDLSLPNYWLDKHIDRFIKLYPELY